MKAALIGKPLGHSYSKVIHERLGYSYELKEIEEEALESLLHSGEFDAFNVTIPYKKTVMPLLDEVDLSAHNAGAVNTVIARNRRLIGYNTDVFGLEYLIKDAGICLSDKEVLILGTGGTSNTAAFVCQRLGAAKYVKVGRTSDVNYDNCYQVVNAQIIINTTPAGMYPMYGAPPIDISRFPRLEGVVDVIYNPLNTELVEQARGRGVRSVGGLKMLVAQAVFASELFCGTSYPERVIEDLYRYVRARAAHTVLVGMPSSGKTTIGKILSQRIGVPFVDTDSLVEEAEGKSIPEIFRDGGEQYFRDAESLAIERAVSMSASIIATGGGAVLRENNRALLRRNAVIIHVERPLECLSSEGRPLSSSRASLAEMERVRMPIYRDLGDFSVVNNGSIDQAVKMIEEVLL